MTSDGSLPNKIEQRSKGWIVVYRISEWKSYDQSPVEDRAGWPYMPQKEGEMEVALVLYDPDLKTFVVIVED